MKWQYDSIELSPCDDFENVLKCYGEARWEVITVKRSIKHNSGHVIYLKRLLD
jgi:hypothetical protein